MCLAGHLIQPTLYIIQWIFLKKAFLQQIKTKLKNLAISAFSSRPQRLTTWQKLLCSPKKASVSILNYLSYPSHRDLVIRLLRQQIKNCWNGQETFLSPRFQTRFFDEISLFAIRRERERRARKENAWLWGGLCVARAGNKLIRIINNQRSLFVLAVSVAPGSVGW